MTTLILINGCGGAGKDTTGRLLLKSLPKAALLDIKGLSLFHPWEYSDFQVGLTNAASLVRNYCDVGYPSIIFSGGLNSQERIDFFTSLIPESVSLKYFWLDVPKSQRDIRRIDRRRDDGDQAHYLDAIDEVFTDPGTLTIRNCAFERVEAAQLSPQQVMDKIKTKLNTGK
ncbi:MAG: hypothetical protein KDD62_01195 [Bdellovibrionales bacterium]|nr:hypothetical protein [Bdellovibrionales bacterium]